MSGPALDIVGCNDPIVCVLAGPGTGKTYALTRKVARLLEEGNNPERILVATFTRTAADDLVRKVTALNIDDSDKVRACTLHSFCYGSLKRRFGNALPRPLLKFERPFLISDLGPEYGNKRDRRDSLDGLVDYWVSTGDLGNSNLPSDVNRDFADTVSSWLEVHRAIFLDQLVPMMLEYIEDNQDCPEKTMFDHILVDEYQDLNVNEQRVIDILACKSSLMVIGDDDQSVYGFKHANPGGIIDFPKTHPGARVKTLTTCRRSPKEIVRIANNLIRHNKNRFEKELVPLEKKPDGSVSVENWATPDNEVGGVTSLVRSYLKTHGKEGKRDILILCPRRKIASAIKRDLVDNFIDARSLYSEDVLDTVQSQECMTILSLISNPRDPTSLRVWLGLSGKSNIQEAYEEVIEVSVNSRKNSAEVLEEVEKGELEIRNRKAIVGRLELLWKKAEELRELRGLDLIDAWVPEESREVQTLRELALEIAEPDQSPRELYDAIVERLTRPETPTEVDYVRVMSLHKAKGLGAKMIVITSVVEGLIPAVDSRIPRHRIAENIEEQRRLFYVAISRTEEKLVISYWRKIRIGKAKQLSMKGLDNTPRFWVKPEKSRFIDELGI